MVQKVHKSCYIADTAIIIGDVTIEKGVSIWDYAVLRGDLNRIYIDEGTNIQEHVMIHVTREYPTIIGKNVTVGHGAVIHCATIKDNVVVGAQATILDGAVIGNGSIIGAHSVVLENMEIPPKSLVVGVPGKIIRSNDDSLLQKTQRNAELYHELRDDYRHNRYTRYDKCK